MLPLLSNAWSYWNRTQCIQQTLLGTRLLTHRNRFKTNSNERKWRSILQLFRRFFRTDLRWTMTQKRSNALTLSNAYRRPVTTFRFDSLVGAFITNSYALPLPTSSVNKSSVIIIRFTRFQCQWSFPHI